MANEIALYSQYPAVMMAIDKLRLGDTLSQACSVAGITTTLFRRIVASDATLNDLYVEAKTHGDDILADSLLTLHEVESDPRVVAILSKNIQWLLERRNKAYSPRVEHNHNVSADKDLIAALSRGRQRVMEIAAPSVVEDAAYIEVPPEDEDISAFL